MARRHTEYDWGESEDEADPEEPTVEGEGVNRFESEILPPSIQSPSYAKRINVKRVLLMFNPQSGAKKGRRVAQRTTKLLVDGGAAVDIIGLESSGQCTELCATLELSNYDCLCILGGDGTFHEAVNGIMKRKPEERTIPLATLPAGTGNSFCLELTGSTKIQDTVRHVLRGLYCPMDLAKVQYEDSEQKVLKTIYSFNSIHWGLASSVVVTAEKLRWMGKPLRYTTASFYEFFKGDKELVRLNVVLADGTEKQFEEEFCLIIVNNIVSAAKGMKMAPDAKINDGLIDMLLFRSANTFSLLHAFADAYSGKHTSLDHVEYLQVKSFTLLPFKSKDRTDGIAEEMIDIDGELKGMTPFSCEVVPLAVNVIL